VPKDIYGIIATEAGEITQGLVQQTINATGRGGAKNSVMITSYGAREDTCIDNIGKKMDKALAQDVGKAYNQAISNKTGAVRDFTATIKSLVKTAINDGITEINWTTADGFKATTEYNDMEARRVRAGAFNCVTSKETPFDDIKTIGAMAPNLIHSIDATHLRMVINNCDFGLVTVHDSIGSHPCDFQETALQIRKQFVAVHQYDALSNLCDNLNTDEFDRPEFLGDYKVEEALEATYIFS
jgi:DNA-directed RNA polymerase